jgi:hypothetical protein
MTSATWYIGLAQSWYKKVKALGSTVAAERLKAMMRLDKATFTTDFGNDGRNAFFLRGTRPGILQGRRVRGLPATNKVPCVDQMIVGEPLLQPQLGPTKLVRFADQCRMPDLSISHRHRRRPLAGRNADRGYRV